MLFPCFRRRRPEPTFAELRRITAIEVASKLLSDEYARAYAIAIKKSRQEGDPFGVSHLREHEDGEPDQLLLELDVKSITKAAVAAADALLRELRPFT